MNSSLTVKDRETYLQQLDVAAQHNPYPSHVPNHHLHDEGFVKGLNLNPLVWEVIEHRKAQDDKHGDYNSKHQQQLLTVISREEYGLPSEANAKQRTDDAMMTEQLTFGHILTEELCEVIEAKDEAARREELIQVAAVALQWIEAIDRKTQI